jgi:hypothetical protein
MPRIEFDHLPPDSRVWIFAADRPLADDAQRALLAETDAFLDRWQAHGEPLRCAREWRDGRFLVVGVDQGQAHASGCSVDGLFRIFQRLEQQVGVRLLGGGRVFYRGRDGAIASVERGELKSRVASGDVGPDTTVLDTNITSLADYRDHFERPARESWVGKVLDRR